jgi:hypothetical protein
VPLRCTCGALLPEDARFCHKCGKPQYEEDIERINAAEAVREVPVAAAPVLQRHPPSRIGFGNGRAVRITLAVAGLSLLAISVIASLAPPLVLPIMVAAGFTSVRIYLSRTAENLTASGGAALGAMTWLWLFLVEAIGTGAALFTVQGREVVKSTLKRPELAQFIDDPQKLILIVALAMVMILVIGGISSAIGGILAVRLQPRGGSSN